MDNEDFTALMQRTLPLPGSRTRIVAAFSKSDFLDVDRGVLVVFARWSAPAHVALKTLTRVLAELGDDAPVLYVADHDALAEDMQDVLGGLLHGYAETFWVCRGAILSMLLKYGPRAEERVRENCRQLLEA